ncbi:hypothetical protein MHU86_9399 [Fragilaria crotonensis]|nr:hypothetical protein MHU86_9399 [Fragilaria crotonensis]
MRQHKPEPKTGPTESASASLQSTPTRQLWLARNAVLHADTEATTTAIARTAEQIEVSYYHKTPTSPIRRSSPLRSQPSTAYDWILHNSQTMAPTRQILRYNTYPRRHTTDIDTKLFPNDTVIGEHSSN